MKNVNMKQYVHEHLELIGVSLVDFCSLQVLAPFFDELGYFPFIICEIVIAISSPIFKYLSNLPRISSWGSCISLCFAVAFSLV
jgi:hypothetical protein